MADPSQKFHLLLSGSKTLIQDSSSQAHNLVKTYKFSSRVLVNLVWEATVPDSVREEPFLRANVAMRAQEVKVPEVTHVEEDVPREEIKKADKEERSEKGGDGVKKVPKWLRLGKK
ncbi:hypothetical protein E4U22_002230 [Claviceps purpurea]|nr:hypothetical protein E4U22_002230 [Claviceps purpurea]